MKQFIFIIFFSVSVFSQKITEKFQSVKLGESRQITIGLPESYEKKTKKNYPILVLLDGDYLFDPFYGALKFGSYWDEMPETIVVGIHQNYNKQREIDCTYDNRNGIPTEKGDDFFYFIGNELLPYIEKKYRVAPFRIVAGHDITAGYMNFFLYKDYSIFNAYISLCPELEPAMERRIPERFSALKQPLFYYQSVGEGDINEILKSANQLDENIKATSNSLIDYKFDKFKAASHYSTVLYSIPNALNQIFDCYKPISMSEFSEKIANLPSGQVKYLTDKYDKIMDRLNIETTIRVTDFKAIEASILKNKSYEELEKLSELARKNHPRSMLADYELGLMYEKLSDPKRAAKTYQKATLMEEIGDLSKVMMEEKYNQMQSLITKK